MTTNIYLDACSTTPPLTEVVDSISSVQTKYWGNPSSIHAKGYEALAHYEESRSKISRFFGTTPQQLIFTSGSTESIYLALHGYARNCSPGRIVISDVEHPAVVGAVQHLLSNGWDVRYWPVNKDGILVMSKLDELLAPPTKIVSICWAQPEIGTIQPISLVSNECKQRGIIFHTDATQLLSQGYINFNTSNIDMLSASCHKCRGPKGIGFLVVKDPKVIQPYFTGGNQESFLRSGTQSVALAAGASIALDHIRSNTQIVSLDKPIGSKYVADLTKSLRQRLSTIPGIQFTGSKFHRLPHHISLLLRKENNTPINGRVMVKNLSNKGIYCSSGTACKSGIPTDSAVLKAIGVDQTFLQSGLRFSLGDWLTDRDIDCLINEFSSLLTI